MAISVCIPSRGRSELLERSLAKYIDGSVLPDTVLSVVLDDDDAMTYHMPKSTMVKIKIIPRPDTLGAKWNAAAIAHKADIYVIGADDAAIVSPAWDQKLQHAADHFQGSVGVLFYGKVDGVAWPGIAVTQKYIDVVGRFCPEDFPVWFSDTEIDEIGRLADRILYVDLQVELLQPLGSNSRGIKDVQFWAEYFDRTRPLRRLAAEKIIEQSNTPPWRAVQLRQRMPHLEQILAQRNSKLRDRAQAAQLEQFYSFDAGNSERYERVKAAAVKTLDGMK